MASDDRGPMISSPTPCTSQGLAALHERRQHEVAERPVGEQQLPQRLPLHGDVAQGLRHDRRHEDGLAGEEVHLPEEAGPPVAQDLPPGRVDDRHLALEDRDERVAAIADSIQRPGRPRPGAPRRSRQAAPAGTPRGGTRRSGHRRQRTRPCRPALQRGAPRRLPLTAHVALRHPGRRPGHIRVRRTGQPEQHCRVIATAPPRRRREITMSSSSRPPPRKAPAPSRAWCSDERLRASPHARARRGDRVAQLRAARPRRAPREGRPGRLLDADLHQLAAHGALHPRLVAGLPGRRAGRARRPHAGVLVRARPRARPPRRCGTATSTTRSPPTTTTRSGAPSTTTTGRRCTSSTATA